MAKLQQWFYKYNAWSFTKHRLWRKCKLEYYYTYIGTALAYPQNLNVNQLKELKKLDSRFVLQGKLIHDIIEKQLNHYRSKREVDEHLAEREYITAVETYRTSPQSLTEYFNGAPIKQSFFDRVREDGLDQLNLFFGVIWPKIEERKYLRHEKFDRFKVDNVEAIVKVDYVGKNIDDLVLISDWKTGADNEEYENDLQVGAYVLWATKYYKIPSNQVSSELVYLTTGRRTDFSFSVDQLRDLEVLIVNDFNEMNRSYEMEDFEANPSPRNCIGCSFSSVCSNSQAKAYLE